MSHEYKFMNGVMLKINMMDVDFAERYEDAFAEGREAEKKLPKDGKASDRMRAAINMYDNLIDKIFGDGTAKSLFGESKDAGEREDVVYQIINICKKQLDDRNQVRRKTIYSKYTPKQRR